MPRQHVRCPPDQRMLDGFARVRRRLDVPAHFADDVLAAAANAAALGPRVPPGASDQIIDATDLPFVAIDPVGSTDLDQAFCARRTATGYTVFYAIADVAAFVMPGDPVDAEARRRGLTLYSPDLRTSLHPESISEQAGSLLEGQLRRALLWTIDLDHEGELQQARLERADVRNRAQLSYGDAQAMVDQVDADHPVALLAEIGPKRLALEVARGAVSLALPSQEVTENAQGGYELEYDESYPIESWNAQISLLTGIAASRIMIDGGVGLLRTLPEPDGRTVGRLRRTARALDIDWPGDVSYADRVRDLRPDTPQRAAMLSQAARGLRGAGYVAFHDHDLPEDPEHSAIASTYAHVTAPLRRLCDRFANEIVLAQCAGIEPPAWAVEALDELPSLMGSARSRDRNLERSIVDFVEAVVLQPHRGETFDAVVTDVDAERDRGRIQLRDPAVVARLPATGLELGQPVRVTLLDADPDAGQVRFALAD
ncbi:MAG: RNB domain-containing ribonuclease [Actinomycetota bacterium]